MFSCLMRMNLCFLSGLLCTMGSSQLAFGWSDLGHQTVGEIAQRNLTPAGRKLVSDILGHGPLAEATTFPDLVRSDADYREFSPYHFIEIDPRHGSYDGVPLSQRAPRDAHSIIANVPLRLFIKEGGNDRYTQNQMKDLLRYLAHVVGDVHQPLHVGNGYDRGGNACRIQYPRWNFDDTASGVEKTNLHSFWDSQMVAYVFKAPKKNPNYQLPSWKGYTELADLILSEQDSLANKTDAERSAPTTWYSESTLLHTQVYPDEVPVSHPSERTYCQRVVKDERGDVRKTAQGEELTEAATTLGRVTLAYMNSRAEIVKRQILKGGWRLAYILNTIGEARYGNNVSDPTAEKLRELNQVLEDFKNKP